MMADLIKKLKESKEWSGKITLKRNELLIRQGTVEQNIYFVNSGTLRVYSINNDEEHTIRFGYVGTLFTALDSFFTGLPTHYSIEAIRKSELLLMSKKSFQKILHSDVNYQLLYLSLLEQLIVQQMEREQDLLITSPAERYKRVLARSPHLFQEIPNKYIASYLRMTPETLSRLKKS